MYKKNLIKNFYLFLVHYIQLLKYIIYIYKINTIYYVLHY